VVTSGRGSVPQNAGFTWHVNWPLLLGTVACVAVIAPLGYLWHSYQLRRHGSVFLSRAAVLEEKEEWGEAVQSVERYLRIYPEDAAARARLARDFDHLADESPAKIPTAERLYGIAVGLAPDQTDLRIRHAERLMQVGRFRDALAEINAALGQQAGDTKALRLKIAAAYGNARARGDFSAPAELIADFQRAIDASKGMPEQIDLSIQFAEMYRHDLTEPSEDVRRATAKQIVDDMVAANPAVVAAWVGRYLFHARNDGTGSDADLDRALELDTEHANVLVQLAAAERAKGKDNGAAAAFFENAIAAHPNDARSYLGLAQLQANSEQSDEAIATMKRGLSSVGQADLPSLQLTLASLYLSATNLDDAEQMLNTTAKQLESRENRMTKGAVSPLRSTLDALRGQWHMEKQQWSQAIVLLNRSVMENPSVATKHEVSSRAQSYMQLGRCYTALRHWDQAAMAFKEAAALLPQAIAPQFAAARSWEAAGRMDEAVREFRNATLHPEATDEVWASLIEGQIRKQVTSAAKQRDWQAVEESIAEGRKRFPESKALTALVTQLNDLRQGTRDTLKLMEAAQAADPRSASLTELLLLAYEAEKQPDKADALLGVFAAANDSETAVVLMRANLLTARGKFEEAWQQITAALPLMPAEQQEALQFRAASIAMRSGKMDEARRILQELASHDDRSEILLEMLADLAMETRDLRELAHWEEELRKQEGANGTGWRFYRVQRLLSEATGADRSALDEAEQTAAEIVKLRPMWSIGLVLQGQIAARRGQPERAIDAYRKAIALGETRRFAREQLVTLLYATGQFEELREHLDELGDAAMLSPRLGNIAVAMRIRQGDSHDATRLAQQQVDQRPDDAMSFVVLGQSLLAAKQNAEAEEAFRKAITVSSQEVRAWQGLFGFLMEMGRREEAAATVAEMARSVKLPERDLILIVAQDQLLLDDQEGAAKSFRKALELAPTDTMVLNRAVAFFTDRDPEFAERSLRRARELDPEANGTRLGLASFLIGRGEQTQLAEAAGLLDSMSRETKGSARAQGLQARLLLRRGQPHDHQRAEKILEDLAARGEASDEDRAMIVDLYQIEGRAREAQEHAFALVNRNNPQPRHLARYVDLLLKDNRATEAGPWLKKLSAIDPQSFATLTLRARLLAAERRYGEIDSIVGMYFDERLTRATTDTEKSKVLLSAGNLFAQLQMDEQAERFLRRAAKLDPAAYPSLANWLARHDHIDEAVALLLQAGASDDTAQTATVLAESLSVGNTNREVAARAEPLLNEAWKKHGEDTRFLSALATWRLVEDHGEVAIPILRKVLQIEPRNILAMNNLTAALSQQAAHHAEARELIDRALAQGGPIAELLDTKGTLLLDMGDIEGAIGVLQDATSRSVADARHFLHLSVALQRVGKLSESREAIDRARKLSLDAATLTPRDRKALEELERDLKS
jgi:tetratricopeptide (TPR) repeat protein